LVLEQSMAGIAITPEHLNEAFQQLFKQGSS
jgi:hypothetical protein